LLFAAVGCGGQVGSHDQDLAAPPVASSSGGSEPIVSQQVETGPHIGLVGGTRLYLEAAELFPSLKSSELTAITFASLHIADDGALWLDDAPLFAEGRYVGDPAWPALVASLEQAPTHVRRTEALLEPNDAASVARITPNLRALRETLPSLDAVVLDDCALSSAQQVVELAGVVNALGLKLSLLATPSKAGEWGKLRRELDVLDGALVERMLLDLEPGGTEHDVDSFRTWFAGLTLEPGWSARHGATCNLGNAPEIVTKKAFFLRDRVPGAWVRWLDDSSKCDAHYAPPAYARAINEAWTFQR
jgi:hypothetical protein